MPCTHDKDPYTNGLQVTGGLRRKCEHCEEMIFYTEKLDEDLFKPYFSPNHLNKTYESNK